MTLALYNHLGWFGEPLNQLRHPRRARDGEVSRHGNGLHAAPRPRAHRRLRRAVAAVSACRGGAWPQRHARRRALGRRQGAPVRPRAARSRARTRHRRFRLARPHRGHRPHHGPHRATASPTTWPGSIGSRGRSPRTSRLRTGRTDLAASPTRQLRTQTGRFAPTVWRTAVRSRPRHYRGTKLE